MNIGYPDTKNKQGGPSPLMKRKGWLKKAARKVGKIAGKVQSAAKGVKEAYQAGKASAQT